MHFEDGINQEKKTFWLQEIRKSIQFFSNFPMLVAWFFISFFFSLEKVHTLFGYVGHWPTSLPTPNFVFFFWGGRRVLIAFGQMMNIVYGSITVTEATESWASAGLIKWLTMWKLLSSDEQSLGLMYFPKNTLLTNPLFKWKESPTIISN